MEKLIEVFEMENKELIEQQIEIEEAFGAMIEKLKKMEDEVYVMRQQINHSLQHMVTKPEKTLLIGQLRAVTNTINQMEETLGYFKNDKSNEISEKIWAKMRELKK